MADPVDPAARARRVLARVKRTYLLPYADLLVQDAKDQDIDVIGDFRLVLALPYAFAADQPKILQADAGGRLLTAGRLLDGGGASVTVGQKLMASSLPVVIASDQTALSVNIGNATSEVAVGAQPAFAATMDWPMTALAGFKVKALYLSVTTAFAWVTAGAPTIQPYVGRTTSAAVDVNHPLVKTAAVLVSAGDAVVPGGATANGIALGLYAFTDATFPDLAKWHPFMGFRLVFGSAPTAGALSAFFEASPV